MQVDRKTGGWGCLLYSPQIKRVMWLTFDVVTKLGMWIGWYMMLAAPAGLTVHVALLADSTQLDFYDSANRYWVVDYVGNLLLHIC